MRRHFRIVRLGIHGVLAALLVLAGRAAGEESVGAGLRASPSVGAGLRASLLLVNGDFEEGTGGDVPGWSRSFYPQQEGNVGDCLGRSDERARSGGWSLRVDTGPVVGEEVTLVFNGAVAPEAARLKGQRLVLSGWIYAAPDTAARPIGMRLRTFGPDAEGKNAFRGDVLEVKVLGRPGEWVPFRATGTVAEMIPGQRTMGSQALPDNQGDHFGSYSWLWWTNGVDRHGTRMFPDAPEDTYGAFGHGGPRALWVIPRLDLVVSYNDSRLEGWVSGVRNPTNQAMKLLVEAVVSTGGR